MFGLFLFAAFVGAIVLSVVSPGFRKFMAGLIVTVALVVLGYFLNVEYDREKVSASQLQFVDLEMSSGGSYALAGRVRNNSPYTVKSIKLKVDAKDCNDQGHCDTVGEAEQTIYTTIPAGQVRDIAEAVYFPDSMRIEGKFEWNYSITEIEAQ